jgi:hypothetical protein
MAKFIIEFGPRATAKLDELSHASCQSKVEDVRRALDVYNEVFTQTRHQGKRLVLEDPVTAKRENLLLLDRSPRFSLTSKEIISMYVALCQLDDHALYAPEIMILARDQDRQQFRHVTRPSPWIALILYEGLVTSLALPLYQGDAVA